MVRLYASIPNPRGFPLPLRFLHIGHVGFEGLDEAVVARGDRRQIAEAALEISIRIRREQRFPMPEPPFHILNTQPRENRLLPDLHAVPQPRDLRIDRLDFLVFFSQFSADLLMGLPVAHMPLVQCLNALQDGLALFSRFVRLPPLFFDLVFQLF